MLRQDLSGLMNTILGMQQAFQQRGADQEARQALIEQGVSPVLVQSLPPGEAAKQWNEFRIAQLRAMGQAAGRQPTELQTLQAIRQTLVDPMTGQALAGTFQPLGGEGREMTFAEALGNLRQALLAGGGRQALLQMWQQQGLEPGRGKTEAEIRAEIRAELERAGGGAAAPKVGEIPTAELQRRTRRSGGGRLGVVTPATEAEREELARREKQATEAEETAGQKRKDVKKQKERIRAALNLSDEPAPLPSVQF